MTAVDDEAVNAGGNAGILDIVGQAELRDAGNEPVLAAIRPFDHQIVRRIDDVDIIATAAVHGVGATAADEHIVAVRP